MVLCFFVLMNKDCIERNSRYSNTVQSLYERAIGGKKEVILFSINMV